MVKLNDTVRDTRYNDEITGVVTDIQNANGKSRLVGVTFTTRKGNMERFTYNREYEKHLEVLASR